MSRPLKLVFLGTTMLEVEEFMKSTALLFPGSELKQGAVAGKAVYRFSSEARLDESEVTEFTAYGVSIDCDFRGLLRLLVSDADGAVGLIPADLVRLGESRQVLGFLHLPLQDRRADEKELPFLVQYHWAAQATGPSPQELDSALGINGEVVERVFSRAGGDEVTKGITALLASNQRLKSSPK